MNGWNLAFSDVTEQSLDSRVSAVFPPIRLKLLCKLSIAINAIIFQLKSNSIRYSPLCILLTVVATESYNQYEEN